jgi:hypothetical protein
MKTHAYNNNQGRWRDDMPRLSEPKDLPELHSETVIAYAWIVALIAGVVIALLLVCGASMIAKSFAAHESRESVAQAICVEKYGQYGQWRYQSEIELWCSSAATGAVRVVML